jgi:uncharacterized protein (TIGR03546 family)
MILWMIKLINSVRKTIAGRKHPSQLAWAIALGFLLGVIPHGNLLTVALVLIVLTLHVNHALVALVGIGVTLVAPRIDPTFDRLGRWFFEQPRVAEALTKAYQYPLMAWTDLNNTVVMGSFLIGLSAVLPLYLLTYPVFRAWAATGVDPDEDVQQVKSSSKRKSDNASPRSDVPRHRIDSRHHDSLGGHVAAEKNADAIPQTAPVNEPSPAAIATSGRVYDVRRIDAATPVDSPAVKQPAVSAPRQTRVAISASGPVHRPANSPAAKGTAATPRPIPSNTSVDSHGSTADDQHKIDEALSYLLRQLRDSQDKDAA